MTGHDSEDYLGTNNGAIMVKSKLKVPESIVTKTPKLNLAPTAFIKIYSVRERDSQNKSFIGTGGHETRKH